jgi:hypothetical protein
VATTRSGRERKPSIAHDHYERQASLSIMLEEGPATRRRPVREGDIAQPFLRDYVLGQRSSDGRTLARADTNLSPLEERVDRHEFVASHPGLKWGERRPTETIDTVMVPGMFQKPFDEPDFDQEAKIEQQWAAKSRTATEELDPEKAQQATPQASSANRHEHGMMHRFYRGTLRRPAINPAAATGPTFVASLPTMYADAILSHPSRMLDQKYPIHVFDYKFEAGILSSSPRQRFQSATALQTYLKGSSTDMPLRMIHICNDEESLSSLSSNFGINSSTKESGEKTFFEWMHERRTSRRSVGKTIKWHPAYDAARSLICAAFAVDFGQPVVSSNSESRKAEFKAAASRVNLVESQHKHRVAVYMQRSSTSKIPGARTTPFTSGHKSLPGYAAVPTVIICEYSSPGVGDIVSPQPLLGLGVSGSDTPETVARAIEDIVSHTSDEILRVWHTQIKLLHEPHAELEDFIWSQPDNPSRAGEVWLMSQRLQAMLKYINRHTNLMRSVQEDFRAFAERDEEQYWLSPVIEEFRQLSDTILDDYVEPLQHMIDLMYKSVTIRDSRHSLELNTSLWRLSWITFVFLPLTFLSGFFGMNVDTFHHDPSIKWYFVSAVPLFIVVIGFLYSIRKFLPMSRRLDYSKARLEGG